MRRLIWGFAGCTYHIVWNLMHWLIFLFCGNCINIYTNPEILVSGGGGGSWALTTFYFCFFLSSTYQGVQCTNDVNGFTSKKTWKHITFQGSWGVQHFPGVQSLIPYRYQYNLWFFKRVKGGGGGGGGGGERWSEPLYVSAAYIQVHFRLDFIMEVNTMNPDQTAPFGAVWSGSILFAI